MRKVPECLITDFFSLVHGLPLKILQFAAAVARQRAQYSRCNAKVSDSYLPIKMF